MRRTARLGGIVGITLGLTLVPVMPALAHNFVISSTPTAGETVTTTPEFFVVTTNEEMLDLSGEGAGFAIQVTDANGLFYGDGCVTTQGPSMSMAGALGAPGAYTMTYQYVSADGHTLSDSLAFTFAPAEGATTQVGRDAAPVCGETVVAPSSEPSAEPSSDASPEPVASQSAIAAPVDDVQSDESATALGIAIGIVTALVVVGGLVGLGMWLGRRKSAATADTNGAPAAGKGTAL